MQLYSYTDALGLSKVVLLNGINPENTKFPISAKRALLETLGDTMTAAGNTTLLTAEDILFLRNHMNISPEHLASLLNVPVAQLHAWENGDTPIDKTAELLLRLIYRETLPSCYNNKVMAFLNEHTIHLEQKGVQPRDIYYMTYDAKYEEWRHTKAPKLLTTT